MTNRLAGETSPYLLQHADNPVDWWPWNAEALAHARDAGKPILLSIGYAACHWCHVMAHESFEDSETADLMNRLFVNIKVDREERPDIDQIYMSALQALGVPGGWPLTMFLTPDGAPFWGGTYFPKVGRYGQPAFADVLNGIVATMASKPDDVGQNRDALLHHLRKKRQQRGTRLDGQMLDLAADKLFSIMDAVNGGFQGAPKFPQVMVLDLLWRIGLRRPEPKFVSVVEHTLERISNGGIYDHLGGGYSRYSVDERWLAPHFEKMLYDNGLLLELLARACRKSGSELFRRRIEETVTWLLRDMALEGGAFAASLDADSEGEEGRAYVWSREEVEDILGAGADDFCGVYDVTAGGNWEGHNILNRLASHGGPLTEDQLAPLRQKLLEHRNRRVQPGRDDKCLADWNGLAIAGLAEVAIALDRPDWLDAAKCAYRFVADSMQKDGRLCHSARGAQRVFPGMATDHANMAKAALALHQATFDPVYIDDASRWIEELDRHYQAEDGSYCLSADDADDLIVRPQSVMDEATPNANGIAAGISVDLYLLTGRSAHLERADRILGSAGTAVGRNVVGTASLMSAFARRLDLQTVAIVGPSGPVRDDLARTARHYWPMAVLFVAESTGDLEDGHPAAGKTAIEGLPTAYVCSGQQCSLPIHEPEELAALAVNAL
ncbi:Thioredoxin-related protein [Hartmannibacter diazotrophicus]|uniref:Thioredoxin-related protein n=1 Tax=Hartmannibacter diazotrophicus TaxID=1482074 RepID=A0A2C9DCY2_9HYPH|nr:thioredoxin domain-containing protein [Hartmannibacter diazotrophicus]SON58182.1 Thioredoxin-related protein [Hartmannibacter diazotrophicus]